MVASTSKVEEVKINSTPVDENIIEIKSPIVGTFYSSPSPEAGDFVNIGDTIKKGQVICIIEAMKLLNNIESDFDGKVVEVLVKNEQMVEYNQPLFRIKLG
jgi:acetyl-CoA carboxylase biotin carboxyl carrier protein